MPRPLPRISTVVEQPIYDALAALAKRDKTSLSQKARGLLLEALELNQDAGLEAIVARRRRNKSPSISHGELKRRLEIK